MIGENATEVQRNSWVDISLPDHSATSTTQQTSTRQQSPTTQQLTPTQPAITTPQTSTIQQATTTQQSSTPQQTSTTQQMSAQQTSTPEHVYHLGRIESWEENNPSINAYDNSCINTNTYLTGIGDLMRAAKNKVLQVGHLIYQEVLNRSDYKKELTPKGIEPNRNKYYHVAVYVGEYDNQFYVVENGGHIVALESFLDAFAEAEKGREESCKYFIVSPPKVGQGSKTRFVVAQRALAAIGVQYGESHQFPIVSRHNFATMLIGDMDANLREVNEKNESNTSYKKFCADLVSQLKLVPSYTILTLKYYLHYKKIIKKKPNREQKYWFYDMMSSYIKLNRHVNNGRPNECEKLLKAGLLGSSYIDRNTNKTKLMQAAENGKPNLCKLLIFHGCDVNKGDYIGKTALMYAAEKGELGVCSELLKHNCYVEKTNNKGLTALMFAARHNHESVCHKLLFKHVANVNRKNHEGWTALMFAAYYGAKQALIKLLNAGSSINSQNDDGKTAVMLATEKAQNKVLTELIQRNANLNIQDKDGVNALMIAATRGYEEITETLLHNVGIEFEHGTTVGDTALMLAAANGHSKIVTLLVNKLRNLNRLDITHRKNNKDMTALMIAAEKGRDGILQALLEEGGQINETDKNKNTAVMLAVKNGHEGAAKILISNRANLDSKNDEGMTALMIAAAKGHGNIFTALLTAGAKAYETNMVPMHDNKRNTVAVHLVLANISIDERGKLLKALSHVIQ